MNRKTSERKYDGTYQPNYPPPPSMVGSGRQSEVSGLGSAMHHHHPMSVVEATPISTRREPSGLRLSQNEAARLRRQSERPRVSGANYDHNPWADHRNKSERGGTEYYEDPRRNSGSGPMTQGTGPHGTSGKDPRRMDSSKCDFLI